jgi:hypothetical protein
MGIVISADEVQAMAPESTKFLVEHYIARDGITLFHGKFGTWKTPVSVHIAKAICTGQELWGLQVEKATPVLYLEADSSKRAILDRIQSIGVGGIDMDFAFCFPGTDLVDPQAGSPSGNNYQELWNAHRERGYKFVVVDALKRITHRRLVDDDTPGRVYSALCALFCDAAILLIHHDKKTRLIERGQHPSKQDLKELSAEAFLGSQGWIDSATVSVHSKPTGSNELSLIHTKSQAGEQQHPLRLTMIDGGTTIETQPTDDDDVGLQGLIDRSFSNGLPPAQVDRIIAEYLGVSARTARRKRKSLLSTSVAKPGPLN